MGSFPNYVNPQLQDGEFPKSVKIFSYMMGIFAKYVKLQIKDGVFPKYVNIQLKDIHNVCLNNVCNFHYVTIYFNNFVNLFIPKQKKRKEFHTLINWMNPFQI